jgi:hypothetical protein
LFYQNKTQEKKIQELEKRINLLEEKTESIDFQKQAVNMLQCYIKTPFFGFLSVLIMINGGSAIALFGYVERLVAGGCEKLLVYIFILSLICFICGVISAVIGMLENINHQLTVTTLLNIALLRRVLKTENTIQPIEITELNYKITEIRYSLYCFIVGLLNGLVGTMFTVDKTQTNLSIIITYFTLTILINFVLYWVIKEIERRSAKNS